MKQILDIAAIPFRYVKRSLFRKLLISFFTIIALTVTALGSDYYIHTSADIKRQAIANMERLSEQSGNILVSYMSNIRAYAWDYFGDRNFQLFVNKMGTNPDEMSYYNNKFNKFLVDNPIVASIQVINLDGFSLKAGFTYDNAYTAKEKVNEKESARLQQLAIRNDGKGVWVTSEAYDAKSQKVLKTLAFIQAVKDITLTARPIIGVMIIHLSYESLVGWLHGQDGDQGSFYLIQKSDGMVVITQETGRFGQILLSGDKLTSMQKTASGGHFFTSFEGSSSLIVYQNLKGTEWLLVAITPVRSLLKQVNEYAARTIMIGGIALLSSMILTFLLSSRITASLGRLKKGMKSIHTGNYDIAIPVDTDDETGYLTHGFNQMAREINRLIVKVYETELVGKDAEIRRLQSQINPHFLYNTLSTIESLALLQQDERIGSISRSLAKMFRYNVSGGDLSTLQAEIRQIEMYLSIQKIRFDSRFDYSIYLEPGLEEVHLPKLLFQPLVENGIVHGIDRSLSGGTIRVEAVSVGGEDIEIRIWNNGQPLGGDTREKLQHMLDSYSLKAGRTTTQPASIGLLNVQARIRIIYGEQYGITIQGGDGLGTTFTIKIRKTFTDGGAGHETDLIG